MVEYENNHSFQFIKGTCMSMCPVKEINLREREGLLHKLEIDKNCAYNRRPKADRKRIVKSYSRPSAGQKCPSSSELRPAPVLHKTVIYLLKQIAADDQLQLPYAEVYDFIFDRLRAVRFDMVVQGIGFGSKIKILEPIVRFHAYAAYRLCEVDVTKFDPVINNDHLRDCLKQLLSLYDEDEDIHEHQPEMEALYLTFCPGQTESLIRYLELPDRLRTATVKLAFDFSLSCYQNNYVRALKLLQNLPVLHSCTASLHVPKLRRHALQIMNTAYSSKNLLYPVDHLSQLLLCKDITEECRYYGIKADDTGVTFCKGKFDSQVKVKPPTHLDIVENKLEFCRLEELLLGEVSVNNQ